MLELAAALGLHALLMMRWGAGTCTWEDAAVSRGGNPDVWAVGGLASVCSPEWGLHQRAAREHLPFLDNDWS